MVVGRIALLALVALIGAMVVVSLPDLLRYMKMRSM